MAQPRTRVELRPGAVRQLLRGIEIVALLEGMGHAIAGAAGPGHEVTTDIGPNRARVEVRTSTFDARREEATRRSLSSAVDRGRR